MLLELTNFRIWKKQSFEIPDSGLIFLSGSSGSGKSSILNAIYFVLYGAGTKITSWGEKKCSVRLVYKDINVIRTKCPNRLILKNEDGEYEDEVAQGIINKMFGTNFLITSYINQNMVQSFLNLSSSDKMEFLEQLSLGKSISDIKKKTKERIKQKKELLQQKVGQYEVISNEFKVMKKPDEVIFPLGTYSQIKVTNESIRLKKVSKQLKDIYQTKKKIEEEYNKEKVKKALSDKQILLIQDFNNILNNLTTDKKNINYEGDENLQELKTTLLYLKNKREFTNINNRYLEEKNRFDTLVEEEINNMNNELNNLSLEHCSLCSEGTKEEINNIKQKLETLQDNRKKVIEYNTLKNEYEKNNMDTLKNNIEEGNNYIQNLEEEVKRWKDRIDIKLCPCCNSFLLLSDGKLIKSEDKPVDKDVANKEIQKNNKEIIIKKKEVEKSRKELILVEELKNKIDKCLLVKDFVLEEINTEISINKNILEKKINTKNILDNLEEDIYNINQRIKKRELSSTLKQLQLQLEKRKKELDNVIQSLSEEIDTDYTEDELQKEIITQELEKEKIKNIIKQITEVENKLKIEENNKIIISDRIFEEEINIINNNIKELEKKEKIHRKNEEEIKKYIIYLEKLNEYKKWEEKVISFKEEEKQSKILLSYTEIFYKKILEAESIAISDTIENINYYTNYYLEKFFPNDSITIEIKSYKETKKDIKPTICIELGYKGNSFELSSHCVSGGEYDRITLSIVLAFNTIFGNDILMLDESIAHLNEELSGDILEVIKENLKDKLIMVVSHQTTTGLFDTIIDVENIK